MAKAVFITKIDSGYDDGVDRYHFPKQYLGRVSQTVGDLVITYEPRRGGGEMTYTSVAQVASVEPDPARADHFYARLVLPLSFDHRVPLRSVEGKFFETALQGEGTRVSGYVQSAVRLIPDEEFDAILRAGFTSTMSEVLKSEFSEDQQQFVRPLSQQVVTRAFREQAFSRNVRRAYDGTCAFTGLNMRNGGGRMEVDAAHIRPIGEGHNGPDLVRNGLALSKTVHWMFDRGLLSVDSNYKILVARNLVPDPIKRLLNPSGELILPESDRERPGAGFLEYHRNVIFKEARS